MVQDDILTLEEAADHAKVALKAMRKWFRTGTLKGIKAGRLWRVRPGDLERFFERSTTVASRRTPPAEMAREPQSWLSYGSEAHARR